MSRSLILAKQTVSPRMMFQTERVNLALFTIIRGHNWYIPPGPRHAKHLAAGETWQGTRPRVRHLALQSSPCLTLVSQAFSTRQHIENKIILYRSRELAYSRCYHCSPTGERWAKWPQTQVWNPSHASWVSLLMGGHYTRSHEGVISQVWVQIFDKNLKGCHQMSPVKP